jgi:hypothetical protein
VDTALTSAAAGPAAAEEARQSTAYPFTDIEKKWQQYWEEQQTFRTPDEVNTSKPKYYVLDMFPYPRWVQPGRQQQLSLNTRCSQLDQQQKQPQQPAAGTVVAAAGTSV